MAGIVLGYVGVENRFGGIVGRRLRCGRGGVEVAIEGGALWLTLWKCRFAEYALIVRSEYGMLTEVETIINNLYIMEGWT
jgi:hypothetical protein